MVIWHELSFTLDYGVPIAKWTYSVTKVHNWMVTLFLSLTLSVAMKAIVWYWWIWMHFHQSVKKCSIPTPETRKQCHTSLESIKRQIKVQQWMATRGSYVHKLMVNILGASSKFIFLQFSQNIDGFRQNDSQGF